MTMVRVIDGKRYDTDKATEIATWTNGFEPTAFKYQEKTLYRTAKGNWFVSYDGGPIFDASFHAERNIHFEHSNIEAIDADTARKLLEQWNEINQLEEYFPDYVEEA
ncbi:hypothetical protein JZ785_09320 [Alicyclobacillus curvatus]|jgi:hypothetical protein|nr:hypothetical protein JZ785_09320 [Alicyclobacillus curvatus]